MLPLVLATALAAPTFQADSPAVRDLAAELWPHVQNCAGGDDPGIRTVRIETKLEGASWVKVTETEDGDKTALLLLRRAGREWTAGPLTHELAHIWFGDGPDVLAQARAEAVRLCVAQILPHVAAMGLDPAQLHLPDHDLRVWDRDHADVVTAQSYGSHEAMVLLLSSMSPTIDLSELLDDDVTGWEHMHAILKAEAETEPLVLKVLEAFEGGMASQHALFTDPDGDNIPTIREWFAGSDPTRFDSDGDGAVDGAEHRPANSTILPFDGSTICLPRIAPIDEDDKDEDRSTHVEIVGFSYEGARIERTMNLGPSFALERPIDPMLRTQFMVVAGDSEPNHRCHNTDRGLLVSSKARAKAAPLVAPFLPDAIAKVEEAIGLDMGRRSYRLSRSTTSMSGMEWLVKKDHLSSLALLLAVDEAAGACNSLNNTTFRDALYEVLGGVSVAKVGWGSFAPDRAALLAEADAAGGMAKFVATHCTRLTAEN